MNTEKPIYLNINTPEIFALEIILLNLIVDIILDGDNGEIASKLFILLIANFLWFIKIEGFEIGLGRRIFGAIIFDAGLFWLYFAFGYKEAFGLCITQIFYLFLIAVMGYFVKKKKSPTIDISYTRKQSK